MSVPETPTTIAVRLVCPTCSQALQVDMEVTSKLTVTTDMEGGEMQVLSPDVRKQKVAHSCGQQTLDDASEGMA